LNYSALRIYKIPLKHPLKAIKTEALPGGRLTSIDALRGIAALGVVLYHAVAQTGNAVPNNLFQYPVKLGQFVSSFGYVGVFLFFVISGFCIHLQWAKARAAGQPQQIKFGEFWRRRLRRLYLRICLPWHYSWA
jgi:peptidoglycan/LPS O-acetylase OafA/YrhL